MSAATTAVGDVAGKFGSTVSGFVEGVKNTRNQIIPDNSFLKPHRLNLWEGAHGLPDPMGWIRGSKEYNAKHEKPQAPELPPPPPPPPQLPEVTGEAAQAKIKAQQKRGGSGIYTSPQGVPSGGGTTKTLLGQ